jgi:tetracycline repressor-like protein
VPRLVDYAGRFELIRQAAFAVVRDEGVDALSRRRVAVELGTGVNTIRRSVADGADLGRLAADQVVSRRRLGRFNRRTDDPVEAAGNLVTFLLPEDETHLDEEVVWLKLVAACALQPSGLEPPGTVRREFGVAQRGYDDGLPVEAAPPPATGRREALAPYMTERDALVDDTVRTILELVGITDDEDAAAALVALLDGLTLAT